MKMKVDFEETNEGFRTSFEEIAIGKDGQDGESAYQIALNNGFDGTEEAWLQSLHGRNGIDGKDGRDGIDGKDGTDGKDGYTPIKGVDYFDGVDGRNGTDGKDGYTPVKGVDYFDGKDGVNGKDGKDGQDGYTPVKGKDYFTETEKTEMVSAVIDALPVYDGEVVTV